MFNFSDHGQQNILKKHVKLIFLYAKRNRRGYAFFNVLDHVYSEIVKLKEAEIKSNPLVSEVAKMKQNERTPDNKTRHINLRIVT